MCGSSRLVERQTTHAGVLPWIRGRPDLQLGGGARQRLCHVMYLPSEGTSLSVFHNWVGVGAGFHWHFSQSSRGGWDLSTAKKPNDQKTRLAGWSDSAFVQDGRLVVIKLNKPSY